MNERIRRLHKRKRRAYAIEVLELQLKGELKRIQREQEKYQANELGMTEAAVFFLVDGCRARADLILRLLSIVEDSHAGGKRYAKSY